MEEVHNKNTQWKDSKMDKINFYMQKVQKKKRGVEPEPEMFPDPAPSMNEADLEAQVQKEALRNKNQKKEFREFRGKIKEVNG